MKTRHMLAMGIVVPVIFWATLNVCGFVMGNYNHMTRLVSELGAMETRTQYIFMTGLLACSLLSVLFVIGLSRECRERGISTIPALIILTFSFSIGGAAIFPLPLRMHLFMGRPSMLLFLSPLAALALWRGKKTPVGIRGWALASFLIMLAGFTVFMPGVLSAFPGLKQRFFHLAWSLWFIGLGWAFAQRRSAEAA